MVKSSLPVLIIRCLPSVHLSFCTSSSPLCVSICLFVHLSTCSSHCPLCVFIGRTSYSTKILVKKKVSSNRRTLQKMNVKNEGKKKKVWKNDVIIVIEASRIPANNLNINITLCILLTPENTLINKCVFLHSFSHSFLWYFCIFSKYNSVVDQQLPVNFVFLPSCK